MGDWGMGDGGNIPTFLYSPIHPFLHSTIDLTLAFRLRRFTASASGFVLLCINGAFRLWSILFVRAERRFTTLVGESDAHAVPFFALEHCTPFSRDFRGIKGRFRTNFYDNLNLNLKT